MNTKFILTLTIFKLNYKYSYDILQPLVIAILNK